MKDLSFKDIWDDLSNMRDEDGHALSTTAAIFARMAFMEGYVIENGIYAYEDINMDNNEVIRVGEQKVTYLKPHFDRQICNYLDGTLNSKYGISFEAFLLYNDLLVQNEDCKYYYRDTVIKKSKWNSNTGRLNTLLSHISVIEYFQGRITFSEIMGRFQNGMGVAPAKVSSIPDITNKIIMKG